VSAQVFLTEPFLFEASCPPQIIQTSSSPFSLKAHAHESCCYVAFTTGSIGTFKGAGVKTFMKPFHYHVLFMIFQGQNFMGETKPVE